uniref:CLAVATA3/ESR (CLE)-related protein 25-like n=1 Tax=Erigeron canadensis TaxID=72917 RepID=UPI001CB94AB4|nr:CLAVATA3/ESR (CLE)-related protein 25-like [Erigeron canadensis]
METNCRAILRAVLVVGFCWFLLFTVSTTIQAKLGVPSTASFGVFKSRGVVLNYVSKRRVPNGPDPIHNRRTRNNGQPPDRA